MATMGSSSPNVQVFSFSQWSSQAYSSIHSPDVMVKEFTNCWRLVVVVMVWMGPGTLTVSQRFSAVSLPMYGREIGAALESDGSVRVN